MQLNEKDEINSLVVKPQEFDSDLAVNGIYYFRDAALIISELTDSMKKASSHGEEFLLNEGILSMLKKGAIFTPGKVKEWMDCGNPRITLETNKKMLGILTDEGNNLIADNITKENSEIIPPCYIGKGVVLKNS